jgi:lysozyme
MEYSKQIENHFIFEEGLRLKSYPDIFGYWTIGVGHMLGKDEKFKNIRWTKQKAIQQLKEDFNEAVKIARLLVKNFDSLPYKTKLGIVDMAFNLGYVRFSKFKQTLTFLNAGKLQEASAQVLKSKWANQLPNRAKRTAELLKG